MPGYFFSGYSKLDAAGALPVVMDLMLRVNLDPLLITMSIDAGSHVRVSTTRVAAFTLPPFALGVSLMVNFPPCSPSLVAVNLSL